MEILCTGDISSRLEIGIIEKMEVPYSMNRLNIQVSARTDWDNMSNEDLVAQVIALARQLGMETHLELTRAELLRRMTGGEGWRYFETSPETTGLKSRI